MHTGLNYFEICGSHWPIKYSRNRRKLDTPNLHLSPNWLKILLIFVIHDKFQISVLKWFMTKWYHGIVVLSEKIWKKIH